MSAVLKPAHQYPSAPPPLGQPLTISEAVAAHGTVTPDQQRLEVMVRYPYAWWASTDPYTVAYEQLRQPVLLVPFDRLWEAVELCLGGPVDVARLLDPQQLFNEIFNPQRSARL